MKFLLSILFILLSTYAYSKSNLVKILKISTSKKSLIIDRGSNHKVIEDDYAVLLGRKTQNINDKEFKVLQPIAKLRSVKTYQQTSVWLVLKSYQNLEIGNKLYLVRESELLAGRSKLKVKRSEIVIKKDPSIEVTSSLRKSGQDLSIKKSKYLLDLTLHDKEEFFDSDIDLVDVSGWSKSQDKKSNIKVGIYKGPHAKDFSRRMRINTFEKMLVYYLARVNDPKFDFNKFYEEQRKSQNVDDLQDKMVSENYRSKYDEKIRDEKQKLEKISEKIAKEQSSWSSDYSDEELTELLTNVSHIREKQRRVDILGNEYNFQVYLSAGLALVDNQLLNNAQNLQKNKFDLEVSAESYALKNYDTFKRLTFEASFRSNQNGVSAGNFNAKISEYSLAAHINWYPFQNPHLLDKNILYVGILFRTGLASAIIDSEGEQSMYQVSSIPGLRFGVKYNLYNGIGFRLVGSYEDMTLDRVENTTGGNNLSNRLALTDSKISFSVSKLF